MTPVKQFTTFCKNQYNRLVDYMMLSQTTYVTILAGIVGILAGLGTVGFRKLVELIQNLAIGSPVHTLEALAALPWYMKIAIPVFGACIVGPLTYFFSHEAKGHGVPEVMHDVALKHGVIRPRVVVFKAITSAITIATGGSVGPEGPIVQIGSALGSTVGQWLRLTPERMKVLVGCGAAAGIAAIFNAPIAGAFFSLEIILGNFALTNFSPIIISSVLATAVSRTFLGDHPAFIVPEYALISGWEIPLYAVLGILAGAVAVLFSRMLYTSEDLFEKMPIPEYLKYSVGSLALGTLIIFVPHIYGDGYETIDLALNGNLIWHFALLLVFVKLLAATLTLGSGGSGGIFAPALFLGAVTGCMFGELLNLLFPGVTANSGAYAMVGMGAVVAGATHAPITAILILFELTGDYKIILALMIACTISTIMARRLYRYSIFTEKLAQRGISLNEGREEIIMKSFSVSDVLKTDIPVIRDNASFNEIIKVFMEHHEPYYYVVDEENIFLGMLSTHTIKSVVNDQNLKELVIARDIMESSSRTVSIKKNLAECMEVFSKIPFEHLPVTTENGPSKLVGSVSRRDILDLYNREILRKDAIALKFVQETGEEKKRSHVALSEEYKVEYIPLPKEFSGKTLRELDIRVNHGVTVIAVKSKVGSTITNEVPSPETRFALHDILVVVGKRNDVEQLKRRAMDN